MTELSPLKDRVSTALANKQLDVARQILKEEQQLLDIECLIILGQLEAQHGNYSVAVDCFKQAVSKNNKSPDAYYFLGAALQEIGRIDDALEAYRATLDLNPYCDKAHLNMGNIYFHQGSLDAAEASYRAATRANSRNTDALSNLGVVLKAINNYAAAHECFQAVLAMRPSSFEAHYNIGRLYAKQKKARQATDAYKKAISLALSLKKKVTQNNSLPDFIISGSYSALASLALKQGNKKHAIICYKKALKIHPEHATSLHFLAALGEMPQPPRASDSYVADLFDVYADNFDNHLVVGLKYRIPETLVEMISKKLNVNEPVLDIIDLGCGTGLCGPLLAPIARKLTGVDLSPKMIAYAKRRGIYDDLYVSEIGAVLQQAEAKYDLAVAADVLIYIGDLVPFFRDCRRALKPNGWLAISLERAVNGYILTESGRYAHSECYVTEVAKSSGFDIVEIAATDGRIEKGKPSACFVVLAQNLDIGDGISA